jgi:hypothetical protein
MLSWQVRADGGSYQSSSGARSRCMISACSRARSSMSEMMRIHVVLVPFARRCAD